MIEIEKKFNLNESDLKKLTDGAVFIKEVVIKDIYYDNSQFDLTTKDIWLRARDGKFELKVGMSAAAERLADHYDEIEDEDKIREMLNLTKTGNFSHALAEANLKQFCVCVTTRKKYKNGSFAIDIDIADFENFTFGLAEVELLVEDESQIEKATKQIIDFAKSKGITQKSPSRGKIAEYLRHTRPKHFRTLVEAKVVEA